MIVIGNDDSMIRRVLQFCSGGTPAFRMYESEVKYETTLHHFETSYIGAEAVNNCFAPLFAKGQMDELIKIQNWFCNVCTFWVFQLAVIQLLRQKCN